jgi:hypothetical protein
MFSEFLPIILASLVAVHEYKSMICVFEFGITVYSISCCWRKWNLLLEIYYTNEKKQKSKRAYKVYRMFIKEKIYIYMFLGNGKIFWVSLFVSVFM